MTTTVSWSEGVNLVSTCGATNTIIFEGEPGIGKSSMLNPIADNTKLEPRYVDCALLDLGDLQMPANRGDHIEFVPNKMFTSDKPIVLMLDEIGKAMRPVQNALLTLLLERRIGNYKLPEGSVVFGTTNLATDGVGDMLQAHGKNRVTFVRMRKPDADEWMGWGINNGIEPEVMAWVKEYPHCLTSYTDYSDGNVDNPYIFNPRKQQGAFVSPRSLAHASHLIARRNKLGDDVLITALSGTVGESAARDMQSFLHVADSLTPFDVIVSKPDVANVPDNPVASVITVLGAVTRVANDNIDNWMRYLTRLPREAQFLFVQNAMRSPKSSVVVTSAEFTKWAVDNSWAV